MFDLLITGGTVIDGTNRPRFGANVGITGDPITGVGTPAAPSRRKTNTPRPSFLNRRSDA